MPPAVKRPKKTDASADRTLKVKSNNLKARNGTLQAPKKKRSDGPRKSKAASTAPHEAVPTVKRTAKPAAAPEPWVVEYIQRLNSVVKMEGGKGSDMVLNSLEEDYEQATNPRTSFTKAEVERFRHVIISSKRGKLLEAMTLHVCGGGGQDGNDMDGQAIISWIPEEASKAMKKKTLPERFDHLYALTRAVDLRDHWINGSGGDIKEALKSLGSAWKKVLVKGDSELDIDAEFTRPGINALLAKLARKVSDSGLKASFVWQ